MSIFDRVFLYDVLRVAFIYDEHPEFGCRVRIEGVNIVVDLLIIDKALPVDTFRILDVLHPGTEHRLSGPAPSAKGSAVILPRTQVIVACIVVVAAWLDTHSGHIKIFVSGRKDCIDLVRSIPLCVVQSCRHYAREYTTPSVGTRPSVLFLNRHSFLSPVLVHHIFYSHIQPGPDTFGLLEDSVSRILQDRIICFPGGLPCGFKLSQNGSGTLDSLS